MCLILHDFLKKWNPGSNWNLFDGVSFNYVVVNRLQFVISDIAIELVFIIKSFLIFQVIDLTSCGTDRFTTTVLQGV